MATRKHTPVNRKLEGARLAAGGAVSEVAHGWHVASRTGKGSHLVTLEEASPLADVYACTCTDHLRRGVQCAHILAVIIWTRAQARAAFIVHDGELVGEVAALTTRATMERDPFQRLALLVLLEAIDGEQAARWRVARRAVELASALGEVAA